MTEQQYRVIADRDKGDYVYGVKREPFDRVTYGPLGHDIVRIERPVPTTDMTAMSHESTGFCFCGQMHGQVKNWNEHDWAALRTHAPDGALSAPSPPTREQIAIAITEGRRDRNDANPKAPHWPKILEYIRQEYLRDADAVLALIQNGADR